jgi:hypothetical protein
MATKTLPSRDLLRQLLRYDADTGEFTWLLRPREMFVDNKAHAHAVWNARYAGKPAGGFKKHGYLYIAIGRTKFLAHRLAWLIHYGDPVPSGIDHANGNSWDNSITNLRAATQSQNMINARYRKPRREGFRGVRPAHQRNGFSARISFGDKGIHLGTFATAEEAAKAYQDAAVRLFGEFAPQD